MTCANPACGHHALIHHAGRGCVGLRLSGLGVEPCRCADFVETLATRSREPLLVQVDAVIRTRR